MRYICLVAGLVTLLSVPLHTQSKAPPVSAAAKGAVEEMLDIDGSKNPELIPQWSAWAFAFRVLAGGSRLLPSSVHKEVSSEEAALISREADAAQKIDPACEQRMARLRPSIGKQRASVLAAKAREITLDCRWQILRARERVLQGLHPEAQAALIAFVESTKAGTTFTIAKKQLARFLEPE